MMRKTSLVSHRQVRILSVGIVRASDDSCNTNIRLGMRYFKDLMNRFGGAHFALAGYNAGENRVSRWIRERPGFAQDEFIDDIPFLETYRPAHWMSAARHPQRAAHAWPVRRPGTDHRTSCRLGSHNQVVSSRLRPGPGYAFRRASSPR